ncbi:hypothetical protein ACBJ59_61585, partial [Nonomuraea sp. MTCD27]
MTASALGTARAVPVLATKNPLTQRSGKKAVPDFSVPAIEVADLTQRFGSVLAVDRLSLSVPPGM